MKRSILYIFGFACLLFAGCAENGAKSEVGQGELGASCVRDSDCAVGVCSDDVCAEAGTSCSADEQCLSWEFCDNGTCEDRCAILGVCPNEAGCERGQCVGSECTSESDCLQWESCLNGTCTDPCVLMDCVEHCVRGECVPLEQGLRECPEDSAVFFEDAPNDVRAAVDLNCEYGEECCCDKCHPSMVCHANAGEPFSCFATDACMIPGCSCENDADCETHEACVDRLCQDACATIDCTEGRSCVHGQCVPDDTCTAYWEGAELLDDTCVAQSASGCSNPFTYDSVAACCAAHPGANGCDDETTSCSVHEDCPTNYEFCDDGVCVSNGDCDGYWSGWYVDGDGACRAGAVSGCQNVFPYDDRKTCCAENPAACESPSEEERACVKAGGDWELFNTTCVDDCGMLERPCGQALTWGCDCGPDACWDGTDCVGDGSTSDCKLDSDCPDGQVCEPTPVEGEKVCVNGCHEDSDCLPTERCNTAINCFTLPCPGLCEAATNCGEHSCDPSVDFCRKTYSGVKPAPGSDGVTYECMPLPDRCDEVASERRCECITAGSSNGAMSCSTDEQGLSTVTVAMP